MNSGWGSHTHSCKCAADTAVLSTPVRHDKTLEAELRLEQLVEGLTVLACVGVVDLVVRAHDTCGACADRIGKRPGKLGREIWRGNYHLPKVQLVHGNVVNVR